MKLNERSKSESNKLLEVLSETLNLFAMKHDKVIEERVLMCERRSKIYGRRRSLRVVRVVQKMILCILQMSLMIVLKKFRNIRS